MWYWSDYDRENERYYYVYNIVVDFTFDRPVIQYLTFHLSVLINLDETSRGRKFGSKQSVPLYNDHLWHKWCCSAMYRIWIYYHKKILVC